MTESYRVGRNRPPLHTRFQKGRSGNPGGRPRAGVSTILARLLKQRVSVRIDGRVRRISRLEQMVRELVNDAVAGDLRSIRILFDETRKSEAQARRNPPDTLEPADKEVLKTLYARLARDALAQQRAAKRATTRAAKR